MSIIDLSTRWQFVDSPAQDGAVGGLSRPGNAANWQAIDVPGDVTDALRRAGRIPDPHFDTQARQAYWITARDWWFRRRFEAPALDGPVDLCLDGVDGPCDVWLNGANLGRVQNAFRRHRLAVAEYLRPGDNELLLRFLSIDGLMGGPRLDELAGWRGRRAFLRKPQYNFGWDWALPLPSIGLTAPVYIEHAHARRLTDVHIRTFASGRVDMHFEVTHAAAAESYEIAVAIEGHGQRITVTVPSRGTHKTYTSLSIPDPQLWWPNGFGPANLYAYRVELLCQGRPCDVRTGKLGLREVRLVERPFTPEAGPGIAMAFEVNGRDIFCKGANVIPMEIWPGAARDADDDYYLRRCAEANFNMVRVWGGGVYERGRFYDLCDELGLMVWQDFMFAGAGYPLEQLRDEIIAEADYQLRRLRNHPCLAIWCGCNEDVNSWEYVGAARPAQSDAVDAGAQDDRWAVDRRRYDPQLYTMLLRGLAGKLCPDVPFTESSPASHDDYGNMPNSGNCHISCWKYGLFQVPDEPERFREHFDQVCSFDSEFCIQGPPAQATLRRFLAPSNHWPPNAAWIYHIQKGHRNLPHHEQTLMLAGGVFGRIDSLPDYVRFGQALHVEQMRCEYEAARRDRPNSGGTMVWMFNDCWPTANWSLIDYYRRAKPSYWAARRACAPLLPIIMARRGVIEWFFSNEGPRSIRAELTLAQRRLNGGEVWSRRMTLDAPANAVQRIHQTPRASLTLGPGEYLAIDAVVDGRPLPPVTYWPDGWKDVPWPRPNVTLREISRVQVSDGWQVELGLATDAYGRLVHVLTGREEGGMLLSDNYFDMPAGSHRRITLTTQEKLPQEDLVVGHWWTPWA